MEENAHTLKHIIYIILWAVLALMVSGCQPETVAQIPEIKSTETPQSIAGPSPLPPTMTPFPTAVAAANTFVTAPDDTLKGLRMADLAARSYGGSGIVIGDVVKGEKYFVQHEMYYESDGLTITGLIDVPISEGPFPVVIVNHGYLRSVEYQPGFDSWRIADWLANKGYITIMPDYRNYGGSDSGPNPFRIGFAVDVMNLVAQLDSLPQAIPEQVGIVGHSMGGEISMWPMVLSDEVDAVVLYASMSGDVVRNWEHRWKYWEFQRDAMNATALIYGNPVQSPEEFKTVSPVYYLEDVRMPVMIHHGTMDESVPYWWAEDLWHQMQDAGVDVTFWPYPNGTHTFIKRGFDTFMERNYAFFELYVKGNVNSP